MKRKEHFHPDHTTAATKEMLASYLAEVADTFPHLIARDVQGMGLAFGEEALETARDIFHDIVVWVLENPQRYDDTRSPSPKGWLREIGRNHIRKHISRRSLHKKYIVYDTMGTADVEQPERLAAQADHNKGGDHPLALYGQAFLSLPLKDRRLLTDRYLAGISFKELAQRSGIAGATLRKQVSRIRRRLHQIVRTLA